MRILAVVALALGLAYSQEETADGNVIKGDGSLV